MKIIAFGHRRRVGKDTASKLLITHLSCTKPGLKVQTRGFATKLKEVAYDLYGWAGLKSEVYYENHPEQKDIKLPLLFRTPREIWIMMGMSMREIWDGTWPKIALASIPIHLDLDVVIFKDLRFKNEAEQIKEHGGRCYNIINPREPKHDDPADSALDTWDHWDGEIMNDGTIRDLGKKVIAIWDNYV